MFKDSDIDFPLQWQTMENLLSAGDGDCEVLSNLGSLVDGTQSPPKPVQHISECFHKHEVHANSALSEAASARLGADAVNKSCHYFAQETAVSSQQTVKLRRGARQKCLWEKEFSYHLSSTRTGLLSRSESSAVRSRPHSDITRKSICTLPGAHLEDSCKTFPFDLRRSFISRIGIGNAFSFLIHTIRVGAQASIIPEKEGSQSPSPIKMDLYGEETVAPVKIPQGMLAFLFMHSLAHFSRFICHDIPPAQGC
jgi:hypothetical protein